MDKKPDRCCQRCHFPLQPDEQEHVDGFVFSKHTEADCISRLMDELTAMKSAESVEMDRLRKQLQDERKATPESIEEALKLSGLLSRLEEWLRLDHDHREVKIQADHLGDNYWVWLYGTGDGYGNRAKTLHEAMTCGLDEADEI